MSNDELISILSDTARGATVREAELQRAVINRIRKSDVQIRPDSEPSLKIKALIDDHAGILSGEVVETLAATEIYCVDEPLCNAFADGRRGRKIIVIFDGLLQAIKFYADLIKILDLINSSELDAETQNAAEDFSAASFALLVNFIETGQPLPEIHKILPDRAAEESNIGYAAAVLFLIAHEAAHLILGHTSALYHSERRLGGLRIGEDINHDKKVELEADEYAFFAIDDNLRDLFISSILFFLGPLAFAETFCSSRENKYPLVVNRIARLSEFIRFPDDAQARQATLEIIESELLRHQRLADLRKSYSGDARSQIRETMPSGEARLLVNDFLTKSASRGIFA